MKEGSEQVTINITDIANVLEEQGRTSNEIAVNIEKVSQLTELNSGAAKKTSFAANELEQLAEEMRTTVDGFKI
jgi:methyl-accepting chemotaxis protein